MNGGEAGTAPSDASGTGAALVTSLVQFHARMLCGVVEVLVVDALTSRFVDGATAAMLSEYLALDAKKVVEPAATSLLGSLLGDANSVEDEPAASSGSGGQKDSKEIKFAVDYVRAVPYARAALTRVFRRQMMTSVPAPQGTAGSPTVGVRCLKCNEHNRVAALRRLRFCPLCRTDTLRDHFMAAKTWMTAAMVPMSDGKLGYKQPGKGHALTDEQQQLQQQLAPPMLRDPFFVQQGLYFVQLTQFRVVCVESNSACFDPDRFMTEAEFSHRVQNLSLNSTRVPRTAVAGLRILSCLEADVEQQRESTRKLAKRTLLPPWLAADLKNSDGSSSPANGNRRRHGPRHVGGAGSLFEPPDVPSLASQLPGADEPVAARVATHFARRVVPFEEDYEIEDLT